MLLACFIVFNMTLKECGWSFTIQLQLLWLPFSPCCLWPAAVLSVSLPVRTDSNWIISFKTVIENTVEYQWRVMRCFESCCYITHVTLKSCKGQMVNVLLTGCTIVLDFCKFVWKYPRIVFLPQKPIYVNTVLQLTFKEETAKNID